MKQIKSITCGSVCAALVFITGTGCNRSADDNVAATNTVMPSDTSVSTKSTTKAPVKMTVSQTLGIDINKALTASPAMKGHTISVGTDSSTVILNGKVPSAAQKKTAETIARQKAKGYKIVNKIEVSAKP